MLRLAVLTWDCQYATGVSPPLFDPVPNTQANAHWVHGHCLLQGGLIPSWNVFNCIDSHHLHA